MKLTKDTETGSEVRCPNCGKWQRLEDYRAYTVNPHFMAQLTPVIQCQNDTGEGRICMHIFAPTVLVLKMRHDLLQDTEQIK